MKAQVLGHSWAEPRPIDTHKSAPMWRRLFAFSGPAFLVAIGYMDPGNWATDIEAGSRFHYDLLWVILASNLVAILLQVLSSRLGVVTGRDLPQLCRERFSKPTAIFFWIVAEVAIIACDLAEVLGSAIAINLLFNIALLPAVLITGLDVLLILVLQSRGVRLLEAVILALIATMGTCYVIEIALSHPAWSQIGHGLVTPHLSNNSLFIALGILGATVMPHNLYLHSHLVQSRQVGRSFEEVRSALRYNLVDTVLALNLAFFINGAILVMAAAVFFEHGTIVTEIQQAYHTLTPLLGTTLASTAFGIALLASGQASTITGTLAGQIVMEGFLQMKMKPWLRRLLTRSLALIPAVIVIALQSGRGVEAENHAIYELLLLSQVVLSVQLSFATVPLVLFTGRKSVMGKFVSPVWLRVIAWAVVISIAGLNAYLIIHALT
ncbi:MAG: Nramp family divalent metal transporter [Bacteroidota bacterium]|nr:Nramp family divalent metal transporter [Bacteroidota bacterium]MDP4233878.1 Nramp family divalent metal transporter [Bacteroidota bacterium]MDP4243551.1 Nramp family divalent metal transporter [Bacteroidota bacterium]MDP4288910.1 Nramp family divalent metal transporter [Bacteroidota bacterium]